MKIADRYQLQGFAQELLRCILILSLFIILYVLIRIRIKDEIVSLSSILWFILLSFSEILPFIVAIALLLSQRQMQAKVEWPLLQQYRQPKLQHAFYAWPLLLPLSIFCWLYTLQLKPEVKSRLGRELKNLSTADERPQKLAGGWLWLHPQVQWIQQQENLTIILSAQKATDSPDSLNMGHGQLLVTQSSPTLSLRFDSAQWPLRFREGLSQYNLMELIVAREWGELIFRCNHPLLIYILTAMVYFGHHRKRRTSLVYLAMGCLAYLSLYFIFRGLHWTNAWCCLSLTPALGSVGICWLLTKTSS